MPSRTLSALEAPRAAQELMVRLLSSPALRRAPRGDGHPVLVMPGFTGSDVSTRVMRAFLRRLGYYVHAWRLGRNWGPTDHIIDGLATRFATLSNEHEQRLTLIGHSLGGIYARELARRAPERVRQVVTLGSPIRWRRDSDSVVAPLYRSLRRIHSERARDARRLDADHLTHEVPLTAIFSKTDGVVSWRSCVFEPDDLHECIEVRGSHTGLIHNVASLRVVADRLAQPEGKWIPYVEHAGIGARVWTGEANVST
jgi:pimeloyl-ACP methyl ester carboxylesterase